MLLAMEERLANKMDQTSKAVNEAVLLSRSPMMHWLCSKIKLMQTRPLSRQQ